MEIFFSDLSMLWIQPCIRVRSLLATPFDPDTHLTAVKEVKPILRIDTDQSK